jgi:hypothetical protein
LLAFFRDILFAVIVFILTNFLGPRPIFPAIAVYCTLSSADVLAWWMNDRFWEPCSPIMSKREPRADWERLRPRRPENINKVIANKVLFQLWIGTEGISFNFVPTVITEPFILDTLLGHG